MPSRKRPRSRRAGRSRARRTAAKKILAHRTRGNKPRPIPLASLSKRSYAARERSLHAIAAKRNDPSVPLTLIAKREGTKVETIEKYFPSVVVKVNGKLRVRKNDRFTVTLFIPDAQGNSVAIKTRSSKQRSEAGQYLRDIGRALRGQRGALSSWRGKKIAGVELFTDESALASIEPALSDFALYRALNI